MGWLHRDVSAPADIFSLRAVVGFKPCSGFFLEQRAKYRQTSRPVRHHSKEDSMATKLDKSLKRELQVNGELYMLTISPEGMKLVPKGKRKGHELTWKDLISGQAALAVALNASLKQARA